MNTKYTMYFSKMIEFGQKPLLRKKKKKSSGSSSFYSFEASSAIEVVEHLIAYLGPPFGSHVSQLYGQIASVLLKTAKF